jgi:hypothetical protein
MLSAGASFVDDFLLAALGELNDRREFQDTQIAPQLTGWLGDTTSGRSRIRQAWGRTVAMRAQAE